MAQIEDEEPSLLLEKLEKAEPQVLLLDESDVKPRLISANEGKHFESNLWYLDNGASNHMTGQKSKFNELDERITGRVKFGDGSTVEIKGRGSIILKCKDGQEHVLKEVYFIPNLCSNIISIGQLAKEGKRVTIRGEYMWVFDKQEHFLMKIKRSQNRLYKLLIESENRVCMLSSLDNVSKLWHDRMGHVNYQALIMLCKEIMVRGLPKVVQPREVCTSCLMTK